MIVDAAGFTHAGRRESNEDTFLVNDRIRLYLVADGVGGHAAGEVASELACQIINRRVSDGADLVPAVRSGHESILEAADGAERAGMGATIVALQLTGHEYRVAWVGDSRAYAVDGRIERLTRDHSRVQDLLDAGLLSPEESRRHPERGRLTQALGVSFRPLDVGSRRGRIAAGQTFMLCTDGLTDVLSDADLHALIDASSPVEEVAASLVHMALARDSRDNCTSLVVRVPTLSDDGDATAVLDRADESAA